MNTNQTIDGVLVSRDLLGIAVEYLKIHGERSSIEYNTAEDLQALLDAPKGNAKGELVAHLLIGETFYGTSGPEVGDFDIQYDHEACERLAKAFPGQQIALYAEQPAPVAEQLIERLAQRFPNLENMYTAEVFADWLRAELNPSL